MADPTSSSPRLDPVITGLTLGLVSFGLLMVYSASYIFSWEKSGDGLSLIRKQALHALIGILGALVASRIHYTFWRRYAGALLLGASLLLGLVWLPGLGLKAGGARRWIAVGPLRFQPGELTKFSVLCYLAALWADARDQSFRWWRWLAPLPALLLLLGQPDFGTSAIITLCATLLFFLSGARMRALAMTLGSIGLSAVILILYADYRRRRLLSFWDPWQDPGGRGFQVIQSFVGIQQGGLWGQGLGNSQEKLFFLPEAHNDFIFSVIGEELGFMGLVLVVGLYLWWLKRGLQIAWESARQEPDRFGMLLAAGITLSLGLQGFVNAAVALGLLPTKGLTLPFISYGGSALGVDLIAVGVLLNVARHASPGRA